MPRHEERTRGRPRAGHCPDRSHHGRRAGRQAVQALRLHGPGGLPVPVAERPASRRATTTPPTGRRLNLKRASMPRNKDGKPIDPRDMNRADGFSPGSMLITKVRGLDTPRRRAALEAPADRRPAPQPRQALAGRGDQRAHRQAPPGLGRDRLEPGRPARPRPDHPPGQELHRGRALHRRAAQPEDPQRQDDPAEPRLPHLPRRPPLAQPPRRAAPHALRAHLPDAAQRPASSAAASSSPGTSRWRAARASPAARFTSATAPSGQLGDTNLRDLTVQGSSPDLHGRHGPGPDRGRGRPDRAPHRGHDHRPLLPDERLPARRALHVRPARPAASSAAPRPSGTTATSRARRSTRPPRRRRVPRSTATGCSGNPAEFDASNVKSMSNEHNVAVLRDRLGRLRRRRTSPHIVTVLNDLSRFNTLADRMQQGFLQQLFLGRALIHPQGLSSHAAFQKNGQSVIDTQRLFFDGNSQGGIMGGALTALAPDFDRAVLGVPGMNYSTLLQRSVDFDAYSPDPLRRLPEAARAPALARADPAALGPRRVERLRAAHHEPPAAEHAGAQGADARGVRRPPGGRRDDPDHGPDDRRAHPPAGPRGRALAVLEPVVRACSASRPTRTTARRSCGGTPAPRRRR